MDDQSSTKHANVIRMKAQIAEILLGMFTAELQSSAQDAGFIGDAEHGIANRLPANSEPIIIHVGCGSGKTILGSALINALTKASDEVEQARKALYFIASYCRLIGFTPALQKEFKYWLEVLASARATVAKLLILFAYSRCSFLELPLFADGPELNSYKHRLR